MQRNSHTRSNVKIFGKTRSAFFSILFSFLFLTATVLSAETLIPITVQKGTNLIFLTRKFCTSEYHWKEIAKINNLTPPYTIFPGDVIYAPVELVKTEKLSAKVASVIGGVFVVGGDNQLKRISKGDEIFPGQTLVTEKDGFTHIIFPDNKYTRIASDSKFTLTYLVRLTDKSLKAEFFLEKGRITHDVKDQLKANETFTTRTPVSVTGVRGTEFRLKLTESSENIVETLKGIVNVKGDSGGLSLKQGEGTKVARGENPQPPRKLPPVPVVGEVAGMFKALPVVIAAPLTTDVNRYRLRITTDEVGNDTVLEQIAGPGENFTLLALPDGNYFGFLTALDSENFESPPAKPFSFEVRTVPGPPIFKSPKEGKASFDKEINVQWLKAEEDDSYHLQLATDKVFETIILDKSQKENDITFTDLEPGPYYFRVQAVASDGFSSLYSLVDSWKVQKQAELGPLSGSNEDGVNLRWATMGTGIVYDVQISKNKTFTRLLVSEEGLTTPEFSYPDHMEPGTYYVRVRGVLSDGQASPWTSSQELKIASPPFSWVDGGVLVLFLSLFLL